MSKKCLINESKYGSKRVHKQNSEDFFTFSDSKQCFQLSIKHISISTFFKDKSKMCLKMFAMPTYRGILSLKKVWMGIELEHFLAEFQKADW